MRLETGMYQLAAGVCTLCRQIILPENCLPFVRIKKLRQQMCPSCCQTVGPGTRQKVWYQRAWLKFIREEGLRRKLAKYELLRRYVFENGRICPKPQSWAKLYDLLPGRRRVGLGHEPALPLILSAWSESTGLAKQLRLSEHIEWAHNHGALDQVDAFLRALPENQWHHAGD